MIFKINKLTRWLDGVRFGCLFIVLVAISCFFGGASAYAEDESPIKSSDFKVKAGVMEGMSIAEKGGGNGTNFILTDIIVENPQGKPMFKILPSQAWYRMMNVDGKTINQIRFNYPFDESDTFAGIGYQDDNNTAGGVRYTANHWGNKYLDNLDVSAMIAEGQKYLATVDYNYEFTPGYGVEAHGIYLTDAELRRLQADLEFSLWHNWNPQGTLRSYLSYFNIYDDWKVIFSFKASTN